MRCLTYFARVLGICALCLGAVAFMGCSGSSNSLPAAPDNGSAGNTGTDNTGTPTTNTTTGFTVMLPAPAFPTQQDFALAEIKPDRFDGFATLAPFSINACTGRIIKASGDRELFACFFEDDITSEDAINNYSNHKHDESPLVNASDYSSVKSPLPIIFPEGRSILALEDDTDLELGQFNGTLTNPLFNTKIKKLALLFDVLDCFGEPEWTLPTCVTFTSNMANGKSTIQGSKLVLTWNPDKGSIPPHDRAYVVAIIKFCNNYREIACIKKAVPIINNTATFTADKLDCDDPTIYFDSVSVCFDLTVCVPFGVYYGAPSAP